MPSIADSSAVLQTAVLSQHQTALTLLGNLVSGPDHVKVGWLDLACGKGQIIAQLEQNIPEPGHRAKIDYYAYDIDNGHARTTQKLAAALQFGQVVVNTGEINNFEHVFPPDQKFSFITFTNTVHELSPRIIPSLLLQLIVRLKDDGVLYVYDMEQITPLELGALPWLAADMRTLMTNLFHALGCAALSPNVQGWTHHSRSGWSFTLQRQHLQITEEKLVSLSPHALEGAEATVRAILSARLQATVAALETLTTYKSDNANEADERARLLHDFWSLKRTLGQTV